jgi:hypothetical protein
MRIAPDERKNQAREHAIKGMRRFRYRDAKASLGDAKRSPYFWWWTYLRQSKDYWLVCVQKGVADDMRLRSTYFKFGDVYAAPFDEWWLKRGTSLFSERIDLPSVREVDRGDMRLSRDGSEHMLVEIPLHLTERTIISQVRKLLRDSPDRVVRRHSSAQAQLVKYTGNRMDVASVALSVWREYYNSRTEDKTFKVGQVQGTLSYYQIGRRLKLVSSCMPSTTDDAVKSAKKVGGMKVAVSRALARANNLASHAAIGEFPMLAKIKEPIRWRSSAQARLAFAEERKLWRPLFEPDETLPTERFMVPKSAA